MHASNDSLVDSKDAHVSRIEVLASENWLNSLSLSVSLSESRFLVKHGLRMGRMIDPCGST